MHLLNNDPLGIFRGIRKRAVAEGFLAPAGGVAHHGRHLPVAAFPYHRLGSRVIAELTAIGEPAAPH